MEMVQQLQQLYAKYIQDVETLFRQAKPTDGLFGMGDDPRRNPCHMNFYEAAEQWTKDFLAGEPEQEAVYEAVRFMLETPARHAQEPCFWFLYAAQGLTRELIPRLNGEQCAALRGSYDERYPRRERMPVQKEVYRLLKKGADRR